MGSENSPEENDVVEDSSENPNPDGIRMTRTELEAIENAPTRIVNRIDDDLYEIVESTKVEDEEEIEANLM